jgi:hypothetical protein
LVVKAYILASLGLRLQTQEIALFSIVAVMLTVLIYMFFYMYFRSIVEKMHHKWRPMVHALIHEAVFRDDDEKDGEPIPVAAGVEKLMRNKHFRKLLIDEIMSVKKNMTGTASDNLKCLFKQMKLEKYALKSLKSRKWYIKAKAIQELTVMEIDEFVALLYPYTNDVNELVRMEAQSALVQFNGFEGLRFLDIVTYPISDWQQIKLLQQLTQVPPTNIDLDGWLKSENSSVVVFALKLARNYHRFELHDDIALCLDYDDPQVRLEAINFLCEIATDETSDLFISRFLTEEFKHQLAMIEGMQHIASEKDILFLTSLLDNDNYEMKISAARALAKMGNGGLACLQEHVKTAGYPLNEIFMQIKGELAA